MQGGFTAGTGVTIKLRITSGVKVVICNLINQLHDLYLIFCVLYPCRGARREGKEYPLVCLHLNLETCEMEKRQKMHVPS